MMSLLFLSLLWGCETSEDAGYTQFNGTGDVLTLSIGPDILPAITLILTSSTGQVEVGQATFDPGGGPPGTEHTLTVEVWEEYASTVDRASVVLDSPDRGSRALDLLADSADEKFYQLSLTSYGEEDEVRDDTATVKLWDKTGDADETLDTGA